MIVHRISRFGCKTVFKFYGGRHSRLYSRLSNRDRMAHVAANNGLFFLAGGNGNAPVAANYRLSFLASDAWHDPVIHNCELSSKKMPGNGLGAVSVAKRLAQNPSNCSVLECMSLLDCWKIEALCPPVHRGVLRRAATTLPRFTASGCASGDQYFNTCNSLRSKRVIHSKRRLKV